MSPNFSTHQFNSVAQSCLILCIGRYIPSSLTQLSKANGLRNYSPMASGAVGMREVGPGEGKEGRAGRVSLKRWGLRTVGSAGKDLGKRPPGGGQSPAGQTHSCPA